MANSLLIVIGPVAKRTLTSKTRVIPLPCVVLDYEIMVISLLIGPVAIITKSKRTLTT